MIRTLAVLLICLTASAGCNQANNAEFSKVKAEAEAAKADLAKANARADAAEAELATLKVAKPEPAKQPEEDVERKAAEWVVQSGGTVRISTNGVIGEYPKDGKLPDGGCRVISVDLLEPGRNGRLSNEGVKYLADLEYITSLHLTGGSASGVTDFSFLKGLESLEQLHFNGCGITDAGLAHIKGLTKLQGLDVEHFFGNREITDAGLENLKDLKDLEVLWLWGTNITDAGLDNIRGLTKLKKVNLGRTPITDAGMTRLKGLSDLRELHIADTKITDAGLENLIGLSKLEFLNVNETKVTGVGVNALKLALPKCDIHWPPKK